MKALQRSHENPPAFFGIEEALHPRDKNYRVRQAPSRQVGGMLVDDSSVILPLPDFREERFSVTRTSICSADV
jgi:hypothetical protein